MPHTHTLALSEDDVLFLTELLVVSYLASVAGKLSTWPGTYEAFFADLLPATARESLRSLLREPLRDPEFRRRFNEHFETHPNPEIRGAGCDWMYAQLSFES